jgi:HD superfamily phosphohydrolase
MTRDHNDIYSIVDRLRVLEEGLDKNQRSVNQLSATFKPKTVAVLTAKKDPKNPMAGKLVGGAEESVEDDRAVLEDEMAEDVLEKVKKSFTDFIKQAEQSIDKEVQEKKHEDTDLKNKDKTDRAFKVKALPVAEDPAQTLAPVKTLTNEMGIWEMHGNERDGFEIRRAGQSLPSRFKNLDEAEIAVEMFMRRCQKANELQDYLDEE